MRTVLRPESKRRARALQLLYAWETRGRPALGETVAGLARIARPTSSVLDGAEDLAARVIASSDELDEMIAAAADHWRLERMGLLERQVLRLACIELRDPKLSAAIVIDEALWLTHRFIGPDAAPFVNGVLDRVARRLGRL